MLRSKSITSKQPRTLCSARPYVFRSPVRPFSPFLVANEPICRGSAVGSQFMDNPADDSIPAKIEASVKSEDDKKLWVAAIKLPMYSVGFIPVLVAGAAVFAEYGMMPWGRLLGYVVASILVIAWLNLSNDAFDAQTGVDKGKRESVVNLTGNRKLVLVLANGFLLAGVGLLASLIAACGDLRVAGLLAFSIACGYVYQGPPFRLSYKGLGEPLCFFAFGPSATSAFYLALHPGVAADIANGTALAGAAFPEISSLVWALGLIVGITTTAILFCSHFHQIEGDTAAGKKSPLVRLGTAKACTILRWAEAVPTYVAFDAAFVGVMPWCVGPAILLLATPRGKEMLAFAEQNHTDPAAIAPLKRYAVKWHMAFGFAMIAGLVAWRLLPAALPAAVAPTLLQLSFLVRILMDALHLKSLND